MARRMSMHVAAPSPAIFVSLDFLNLETFFLSVEVVATFAKQMEQFEFERNTTTTFICRIDEL